MGSSSIVRDSRHVRLIFDILISLQTDINIAKPVWIKCTYRDVPKRREVPTETD